MLPSTYTRRNEAWMPSFFNEFFNDGFMGITRARQTSPAVNVLEDEKGFTIEIAAPGMTKDDFSINLERENELTVTLEKKAGEEEQKRNFLRREFIYEAWQKTWIVPEGIETEGIGATMSDGILTISFPKKTEEKKARETRRIEIC